MKNIGEALHGWMLKIVTESYLQDKKRTPA
jgi:hypothetical protein